VDLLPDVAGAYALLLDLGQPTPLPPRFGNRELPGGRYCHVGSAHGPGGIRARCRRHLAYAVRPRWHVDWLSTLAADRSIMGFPGRSECGLLRRLVGIEGISVPVEGFGSSDCARCDSHLVAVGRHGRSALREHLCAARDDVTHS
jgi:Uri superfamily endonuclease